MDKDQYDEQVERLLPCLCEDHHRTGSRICPASYRPVVAAALREAGKREAELRRALHKAAGYKVDRCACIFEADDDDPVTQCNYHRDIAAERDDLRREVEQLKTILAKCVLGAPPGDCYAADVVTLKAEVERVTHDAVYHRVKVEEQREEIAALKAAIDSRDRRCDVALRVIRDRDAEIAALKAKLAEAGRLTTDLQDSNKFLVEAIDAAIKDRDYFEGKLSENDRHGMEIALAALDPTIPGHSQAAKYIRAAIHNAEMEKKP